MGWRSGASDSVRRSSSAVIRRATEARPRRTGELGQREVDQFIPVRRGQQQPDLPIVVFDRRALKRAPAQSQQHRFEGIEALDRARRIVIAGDSARIATSTVERIANAGSS